MTRINTFEGFGVVGCEQGRKDGEDQDHDQHHETKQCHAIAAERVPKP
jgi:hypothetical protein